MSINPEINLQEFTHPSISQNNGDYWFYERSDLFPGQTFGLKINKILYHTKSPYQDILIFESSNYGNVLVLNGIIQCTERDEFVYQELITHLPIMSHPQPKKVLVIGGGDCGVIRELVKHVRLGTVETIKMIEIDDMVINLSKKYLPQMSKFADDESVEIIIEDGFKFLKDNKEKFDIIITDSSDPEGPAEEFFQVNYFKLLKNSLNDDGIVIMQSSENIWLNLPYIKNLMDKGKTVFSNLEYTQCYMPSYTAGQLGLIIASNKDYDLTKPLRTIEDENKWFKYYSSKIHESSFILPTWADNHLH